MIFDAIAIQVLHHIGQGDRKNLIKTKSILVGGSHPDGIGRGIGFEIKGGKDAELVGGIDPKESIMSGTVACGKGEA